MSSSIAITWPVRDTIRILVATLCLWWSPVTTAQFDTLRFEHLTINDGLSQSSVSAILEDERGYLWIGTQDGLNRFDGYDFVVYRHDGDDRNSLGMNNVSSLFEDATGTLWVSTTGGYLHRYDSIRDQFDRFRIASPATEDAEAHINDDIDFITGSGDGALWIGTRARGVWRFDIDTGEFSVVDTIPATQVNRIFVGPDGVLWIGSAKLGLLWFAPGTSQLRQEQTETGGVHAIIEIGNSEIWSAGDDGIVSRYRSDRSLIGRFSVRPEQGIQNFQVRAMLDDGNGHVWIGLIGGGVQVFSYSGERLNAFHHASSDPYSLSTDTVFSLLLDSAGVLWAGSLAAGLSKASIAGARFENFWHKPEDPQSLSHNMVIELTEDQNGDLWIGTSGGGVNHLDRSTGRFERFRAASDVNSLSSDRIWGMHLSDKNSLWIGTWGGGLNRFDTGSGRVQRIPVDAARSDALPGAIVTAIVGDGAGGIWVGMNDGGLVRHRAESDEFERYYLFDAVAEAARPVNISALYLDSKSRLWVGTWSRGLCIVVADTTRCHAYNEDNAASLNNNNIRSISEDPAGDVWIATARGIARFDEATESFERLTVSDGLPQGTIYGILPEGSAALWLSSNQGLARLDRLTGAVRQYDYKDGLQANEFNGDAALKTADGTYFFGGIGGITSFRTENFRSNTVPPKVVLTGLRISNNDIDVEPDNPNATLRQSLDETDEIVMSHAANVFSLRFAGLHFNSPGLNRYAYILEGFDPDWVYTDASRREATYTNLDPGSYVFRVRAANSDGLWSEQDAVLAITVLPPWWDTWIARGLLIAVLLLVSLSIYQWRVRLLSEQTRILESEVRERTRQVVAQKETIEHQARHLEEVLEAKNRFFARLSHEFRTPITLMLGPIEEQYDNTSSEKDRRALSMARRNGRRLLHLVNQLLGLARQSGEQSVSTVPVNVSQIARLLADGFMPLLVTKQQNFDVAVEDDVWVQGNAEGLQIVLSNLVSNAIKYTGQEGRISLSVTREGEQAVIRVTDNGIGIPAASIDNIFNLFERGTATGPGSGIGLTLVKELVDAHDGSINVQSVEGEGSTFEVRLQSLVAEDALADPAAVLGHQELDLFVDVEDAASEGPEPVDEPTGRPQVLVVEDNADMRQYIVGLLNDEYQCVAAADGRAGIEMARRELPDLVISDVMMPESDGFELLAALRNDEHTTHIPVILLTALDDKESRLRGLSAKADDYLGKPFDRRELILRVGNLLELTRIRARRMGQQLYSTEGEPGYEFDTETGLGRRDREFLARIQNVVEANYQDAGFRLEQLADGVHMSPRQLQRKLKALLDTAPAAYLRDYRLKKARQQLREGRAVTDVAFATGFSSVSYFGKCFKSRFGQMPSEIQPE